MSQFINGKRCDALSGQTDVVRDPSTGEVVEEITLAGAEDVDRAVQAARAAFPAWSNATPVDRSTALDASPGCWRSGPRRSPSWRAGSPASRSGWPGSSTCPGTIDNVAFFAGAARNLEGKATAEYSGDHTSSIRREPVGVVGSISPWNYPLQMAAWKVLPAIAAGNTIVLKPSELTPLTSLLFAEIATEAGIPAGVINVLTGTGADCGVGAAAAPRGRHGLLHRLDPGRPDRARGGRDHRQAGPSRTRRQGAVRGLRRRRSGGRHPRRGRRQPDQRRSGLHRRHPGDRAPLALRPNSSPGSPICSRA